MSLLKPFIFFVALVWDRSSDGVEQFDYYTVAYQWPRTFQEINNLDYVLRNYWTIHGFWPSRTKGVHPTYCNNNAFNWDIIPQNVKDRMQNLWPNLKDGDHRQFWKYQWEKHGTCSGMVIGEYFARAIELSEEYKFMQSLSENDITPSHDYYISAIENTIRKLTGWWPTIVEVYVNGYPWLFQIHICFNLTYNVIDCPDRPGLYVYYPPAVGPPLPLKQQMLNGQNSISFSYLFVILSVILSII